MGKPENTTEQKKDLSKDQAGLDVLLSQKTEEETKKPSAGLDDLSLEEGKRLGDYFDPTDIAPLFQVFYDGIESFTSVPVSENWRKASIQTSYNLISRQPIIKKNIPFWTFVGTHVSLTIVQIKGMSDNGKLSAIWKNRHGKKSPPEEKDTTKN